MFDSQPTDTLQNTIYEKYHLHHVVISCGYNEPKRCAARINVLRGKYTREAYDRFLCKCDGAKTVGLH
jgi:hypothetical protein